MGSRKEFEEIDKLLEACDSDEVQKYRTANDSSLSVDPESEDEEATNRKSTSDIRFPRSDAFNEEDNSSRNHNNDATSQPSEDSASSPPIGRYSASVESITSQACQMQIIMESLGTIEPLLDIVEYPSSNCTTPEPLEAEELDDESEISRNTELLPNPHFIRNNKKAPAPASIKKSLENMLKSVGSHVRKQLSQQSFKRKNVNTQIFARNGTFSSTDVLGLQKTYPNQPQEIVEKPSPSDAVFSTPVLTFEWDPIQHIDNEFADKVEATKFAISKAFNRDKLINSLPDQSSEFIFKKEVVKQPLTLAVEHATEVMKSSNPTEWHKAKIKLETTGPKDFRRISLYISGKMEMLGKKILCLAYCPQRNTLAVGGECGMLKLIDLEFSSNYIQTDDPNINDVAYKILGHENLKGHKLDVEHLTWHSSGNRLTTCDSKGIIIGWLNCDGAWKAELIQDRNVSTVLGISWSPQSSRVCFMYQEINDQDELQYGIVMGLLDGSREWNLDLGDFRPSPIAWLEEKKFAIIYDNTIAIYHCNGQKMRKRCLVYEDGSASEKVVAFFTKQNSTWTATGTFSLAIVWEVNRMMLLRNINDQDHLMIRTYLNASCASWSPNGLFIAIGGKPLGTDDISQVNIFSYVGKLLTMLNVSEPSLTSVSWDLDSFNLSIGADKMVFFGKVRPVYKFASNGSLYAYAFTKDGINSIAFWNGEKLIIHKVPGTIVDLKSHEERFALLSVSDEGIYSVSVLNKLGVPVDTLCILTMEPFAVCLTDSCLICLSSNSILLWKYETSYAKGLMETSKNQKNTRQVQVDDNPSMLPTIGEGTEEFSKAIIDPAVCMDAKLQCLCIARASGKLQFYHIPQGGIFRTVEVDHFNPYLLMFNPLADRLALLDMNGCLIFGIMKNSTVEIKRSKGTKEVLNIIWAKDMKHHLCVMERTQMYILRDGKVEETFRDIGALQGYLVGFDDLQVTLLRLDLVLDNPNQPSLDHLTKVDLQIISRMQIDLKNGDQHKLEKLVEAVEKRTHPRLWRILGEKALVRRNLDIAETGFVKGKNYTGLLLLKRIEGMTDGNLQQAEIYCFLEEYAKAEESFVKANRKDLAIKMWKDLGDFTRMSLLTKGSYAYGGIGDGDGYHNCQKLVALGEQHIESRDIEAALECYKKINDSQKILECYILLEDYEGLRDFAASIPKKNPILVQIAATFTAVGMTTDAVKAYLANEDPQTAVAAALDNFQWNLALEVSQTYNIPIVAPVLLNYTGQLIKVGDLMQAVQLLERCDKTFAAGKLLVMMALQELKENVQPHLKLVKTLFVMAAIMLTKKPKKFFKEGKLRPTSVKLEDDIDLRFDESIPVVYRPTVEELHWMREIPWRGAHGVHYLTLVQRQIHKGHFDKATKAAIHLRNFSDILGEERVNCMIALAAANGGNFYICSGTFLQLDPLDEEYSDIAIDLFRDKPDLSDKKTRSINCSECQSKIPDYHAACEYCGHTIPICILTGNILYEEHYVWKCSTCSGTADVRKVKRMQHCPLCHTSKCCDTDI